MKTKDQKIKDEKWNKYDIDKTLAKFNIEEPFYGYISANINKYKTKDLDTAGVTVRDGKMILLYNEEFFNSLNWKEKQGLLIHEFLHLIFNHATSRIKKDKNGNYDKAWFFSCDFAINSLIDEERLPKGGLIPGKWEGVPKEHRHLYDEKTLDAMDKFKKMVKKWPKEKSADWYYEQINKDRDTFDHLYNQDMINLSDDHGGWDSLSSEEKEVIENNINRIIEDSANTCIRNKRWGSVSAEMQSTIYQMTNNSIDWVDFLRYFVGNSVTTHYKSTIRKINKRYPYLHPGKKRKKTINIVVCVDQSGSIEDSDLAIFFSELSALAENTKFVVVPFDSNVIEDKIFVWEKGSKKIPKRVARGGTDFNVPTKWINENSSKFDSAIFMTDGICSKPIDCKIPRCWIITPNGKLSFDTNELNIKMNI